MSLLTEPDSSLKIISCIGKGSFGNVYLIRSREGKLYAMKTIKLEAWGNPVLMECVILSSFDSPYLHRALQILITPSELHIITSVAASDLRKATRDTKLSKRKVKEWIFACVAALYTLHEADIIHGDVKASNLLLFEDGTVKLADFNLSRSASISGKGILAYTATHRPPEVWNKQNWDTSADMWALGCTIFELCHNYSLFPVQTADSKFDLRNLAAISHFMGVESPSVRHFKPVHLPESFSRHPYTCMILDCLHTEPMRRPSAKEFLAKYYGTVNIKKSLVPITEHSLLPDIHIYLKQHTSEVEVFHVSRKLMYKLPHQYQTLSAADGAISLARKLLYSSDVKKTTVYEVEQETLLCQRLAFHLYFCL